MRGSIGLDAMRNIQWQQSEFNGFLRHAFLDQHLAVCLSLRVQDFRGQQLRAVVCTQSFRHDSFSIVLSGGEGTALNAGAENSDRIRRSASMGKNVRLNQTMVANATSAPARITISPFGRDISRFLLNIAKRSLLVLAIDLLCKHLLEWPVAVSQDRPNLVTS